MARRSAIGLDIGTSGVRAAELSRRGDVVTLEKFGQVALPEGAVRDGEVIDAAPVAEAIRHLWSAAGFSHKRVYLGVGNQRVVVRTIELPDLAPNDLRKALPFQVQDYLPMPVDQAVLDFHKLETAEGQAGPVARGMLVAARRDVVMGNIGAVKQAGLRAEGVDLIGFALLRSTGSVTPGTPTEALVDIGARVTNIIVHTGGVPHFVRILLMGGQDITDALSERLGLPTFEAEGLKQQLGIQPPSGEWANAARVIDGKAAALMDEIRGSLDYYASTNPGVDIQQLVVSGGGSKLSGLAEGLAAATQRNVVWGNPTESMNLGDTGLDENQIAAVQSLAAVPVGLALGGI